MYNRISIVGGSGSGKSTLCNILSKELNLPAIHLDAINYNANWDEIDKTQRDEIILNKIESIQNKINSININSSESKDLKESFAEEIDLQIEKINKTNIGNQETKIIVYENSGKTIRTAIQGKDYEINFDLFKDIDDFLISRSSNLKDFNLVRIDDKPTEK